MNEASSSTEFGLDRGFKWSLDLVGPSHLQLGH